MTFTRAQIAALPYRDRLRAARYSADMEALRVESEAVQALLEAKRVEYKAFLALAVTKNQLRAMGRSVWSRWF